MGVTNGGPWRQAVASNMSCEQCTVLPCHGGIWCYTACKHIYDRHTAMTLQSTRRSRLLMVAVCLLLLLLLHCLVNSTLTGTWLADWDCCSRKASRKLSCPQDTRMTAILQRESRGMALAPAAATSMTIAVTIIQMNLSEGGPIVVMRRMSGSPIVMTVTGTQRRATESLVVNVVRMHASKTSIILATMAKEGAQVAVVRCVSDLMLIWTIATFDRFPANLWCSEWLTPALRAGGWNHGTTSCLLL